MHSVVPAPFWRRLAAAAYDTLLLFAIWMIVGFADVLIRHLLALPRNPHLLSGLLFISGLGFCGWFWTHGGQTLGMRAWRLRLQRLDGSGLRWPIAATRYAVAFLSWGLAGAGVLWCLLDRRGRSWHDLAAGTELVLLPKTAKASAEAGGLPGN